MRCLVLILAIVSHAVPAAYSQTLPQSARSPDSTAGTPSYQSDETRLPLAIPAVPAEEVSSTSEPTARHRTLEAHAGPLVTLPIPIPDAYATTEGVVMEIPAPGLIANDYHPDGLDFILSNFFSPEHGSLPSIVTNGAFRYEPPPGFTGVDTFRYILRDADGNFSNPVEVTIRVLADPNRPPLPVTDEYATLQNTALDVASPGLLSNDVDPDGDSFILSNFFSPEHGSLPSIVTNGAFRYVPPTGFTGEDTFRYILRDEKNAFSDAMTVTLHVVPPGGDLPLGIPDHYVTTEGVTLDIPAPGLIANDIDPAGDSFILSNFFSPEHGSLPSIVTNGAFRYVPPPGFVGTDTFRYILRNGEGNFSEPVTVTIDVLSDFNRAPIAIRDFYGIGVNETIDIPAPGLISNDLDPDGDSFILSQFFSPEHGSLPSIVTNGAFRYIPPTDFTGTDTFSYRLRDEHGRFSDFVDVTIFVGEDPTLIQPPVAPILIWPEDGETEVSTSPVLAWESSEETEHHTLQLASDASFEDLVISEENINERSLQINGLEYATTFYWRVMGHNETGDSPWSQEWSFITVEAPPPAPVLVSPEDGATELPVDLHFIWRTSQNADYYTLHLSKDSDFATVVVSESEIADTTYTVGELEYETSYYWRVQSANHSGQSDWSETRGFNTMIPVSVVDLFPDIPTEFKLHQNYPNPFNSSTLIKFEVKEQSHVSIVIYNVLGQRVVELVNADLKAGKYEMGFGPTTLPSGTYLYRFTTDQFIQQKIMSLIK